jgi:putative ABC transport system ATP-binding protein
MTTPKIATGTKVVEARNVNKIFKRDAFEVTALDNVSIDIAQGEFLALMGPSGSGKTTLLNMIAAIDRPTSGELLVMGENVFRFNDRQSARWRNEHVGYVFQTFNLIPVLTAFENVELPLLLTKLNAAQRREHVMTALKLVGLEARMHHLPKQLSGGQEQRVAIARAIVSDPTLLLADEPTGDLDSHSATEILEILKRLNEDFKKTIVMVTHDPHAASYAHVSRHLEKGMLLPACIIHLGPDALVWAAGRQPGRSYRGPWKSGASLRWAHGGISTASRQKQACWGPQRLPLRVPWSRSLSLQPQRHHPHRTHPDHSGGVSGQYIAWPVHAQIHARHADQRNQYSGNGPRDHPLPAFAEIMAEHPRDQPVEAKRNQGMTAGKRVGGGLGYEERIRAGAMEEVFQHSVKNASTRHGDQQQADMVAVAAVPIEKQQAERRRKNDLPIAEISHEAHHGGQPRSRLLMN